MTHFDRKEYELLKPFCEALFKIPGISRCGKDRLPQDVLSAALELINQTVPVLVANGYEREYAVKRCGQFFRMAAGLDKTIAEHERDERRAAREAKAEALAEIRFEAQYL